MKNIIFIGGINGSGKSFLGKKISAHLNIPFYDGSNLLIKELGFQKNDYKSLRDTSEFRKKKALRNIFKRINNKNKISLITGHFAKIVNGKVTKYNGEWFKYCFCLLHIISNPKIIYSRIKADEKNGKKIRKVFSKNYKNDISFINFAQNKSLKSFEGIARNQKIKSILIKNNNKSMSKIKKFVKN